MNAERPEFYILNADGEVYPVDWLTWAQWFEEHRAQRQIARDELPDDRLVSTVFLGLDHNMMSGPPLLFETMVFHGAASEECQRYSTRAQAVAGHQRLVARLSKIPKDALGESRRL